MRIYGGNLSNNSSNGVNNIFPVGINSEEDNQEKLNEDRYELYVNNEYIGDKTLLNHSDSLKDVDDFIKLQGIEDFSTEVEGDHYHILADSHVSSQLKGILSVYCNNR